MPYIHTFIQNALWKNKAVRAEAWSSVYGRRLGVQDVMSSNPSAGN